MHCLCHLPMNFCCSDFLHVTTVNNKNADMIWSSSTHRIALFGPFFEHWTYRFFCWWLFLSPGISPIIFMASHSVSVEDLGKKKKKSFWWHWTGLRQLRGNTVSYKHESMINLLHLQKLNLQETLWGFSFLHHFQKIQKKIQKKENSSEGICP